MKKIFLIALALAMFAACNKNVSTGGSTKIISSPVPVDTITLTDNGVTYTDSAGLLQLSCNITKTSTGSEFALYTSATNFFPYTIEISGLPCASLNSLGVYKVVLADSFVSGLYYLARVSDGNQDVYVIDSLMFNITYAGLDTVKGSYIIWLGNGANDKTLSGILRCYNAQIN